MSSKDVGGITGQVRMIRETRGLTQEQLAEAAGVSLSTVRRLERDSAARFHETTEHAIERALGLRRGGIEHLREGEDVGSAFRKLTSIWLGPASRYWSAPLGDVIASESHIAVVLSDVLEEMSSGRPQELMLLADGKLTADRGKRPRFLWQWLPWVAQVQATPVWLDRLHDSAEQVRRHLEEGRVPRPLRMAEAVALHVAYEAAWVLNTNAFFAEGEEIDDPYPAADELYETVDPRPLFDQSHSASAWVSEASLLHPARWWLHAEQHATP